MTSDFQQIINNNNNRHLFVQRHDSVTESRTSEHEFRGAGDFWSKCSLGQLGGQLGIGLELLSIFVQFCIRLDCQHQADNNYPCDRRKSFPCSYPGKQHRVSPCNYPGEQHRVSPCKYPGEQHRVSPCNYPDEQHRVSPRWLIIHVKRIEFHLRLLPCSYPGQQPSLGGSWPSLGGCAQWDGDLIWLRMLRWLNGCKEEPQG